MEKFVPNEKLSKKEWQTPVLRQAKLGFLDGLRQAQTSLPVFAYIAVVMTQKGQRFFGGSFENFAENRRIINISFLL